MSPTFRALAHRNYRLYAAGGLVSNIGTWMQRVAQDWLVIELSSGHGSSAAALGITTGLQFLPILLFSAYAGSVADRVPKRRMLKLAQFGLIAPAALLGVLALTGTVEQWHVYVLAFAFGTGAAFEAPVRQAFVGELVTPEDVPNAVGLNSVSFNAGRIVGPALAGLLIAALGAGVFATGVVILLNAASYLFVVLSVSLIGGGLIDDTTRKPRQKGMIRDGMRYVRARPDLMLVIGTMFFVGTFGLNFQMTSALMATEVYGKGATEYGVLGTTVAIGSIVGSLLAARRESASIRLVVVAALVFSAVEVVIGLMPTYTTFMLLTPLMGLTAMTTIAAANTVIQIAVPSELRGRVMALYLTIFLGGTPVGSPLIGYLAEAFGARWSLIGGGLVTGLGVLLCVVVFTRARTRTADQERAAARVLEPSLDFSR